MDQAGSPQLERNHHPIERQQRAQNLDYQRIALSAFIHTLQIGASTFALHLHCGTPVQVSRINPMPIRRLLSPNSSLQISYTANLLTTSPSVPRA